jgi:hypothetical protein
MLTQDFFTLLEYRLTEALADSEEKELRQYWCDGVLEAEWAEDFLPHYVAKSRVIVLRAWMVATGTKTKLHTNRIHPLHLRLGRLSCRAYLRGENLSKWIEEGINPNQVTLDEDGNAFHLHLP